MLIKQLGGKSIQIRQIEDDLKDTKEELDQTNISITRVPLSEARLFFHFAVSTAKFFQPKLPTCPPQVPD